MADVEIFDVRGESVNLYVLTKCILSLKLSFRNYVCKYISLVKPEVVITYIDNNSLFYELKNIYSNLITIFVQNGIRGESGDIFGRLNEVDYSYGYYRVDYMLTFAKAVGDKYRHYIEGQIVPIGSLKNNLYRSTESEEESTVVFISQFRQAVLVPDSVMSIEDSKPFYWKDFYSAEREVLEFLKKYCLGKGFALQICGCTSEPDGSEYKYFKDLLGAEGWRFIPRDNYYSSYELVDRAEYVVFIDSTLGYEALARGKKVAAFCIRGRTIDGAATIFGWPASLPDKGPFWTNHADYREFERVLNYLTTVSVADWDTVRQRYVPYLMEYDPGNTRFIALLEKIGVPLTESALSSTSEVS